MIKLYNEQKVSLYKISKDTGIDFKKLYRYANKKCNIRNMPFSLISTISNYLDLKPMDFYKKMEDYIGG